MANINIEDYIKNMDLSPELEEKARLCTTSSELMELAAENDIELSEDALEMVSGGINCGCLHSNRTVLETKCPPKQYVSQRMLRWEKCICNDCGETVFRYYVADGGYSQFISEEQYNNNYSPVNEKNYI